MLEKLKSLKWFWLRLTLIMLVGGITFLLMLTQFAEDIIHQSRDAYWSADSVQEYTKIPLENHIVTQKFVADGENLEEFVMLLDNHSPEDQAVLHVELTDSEGSQLYELEKPTAEVVSEFCYIIGAPSDKLVEGEEYTFTLELMTPGSEIVVWAVESPKNKETFTTMTIDGRELEETDMYMNVKYGRSFSWVIYWCIFMVISLILFLVIELTENRYVWRTCHVLLYFLMYTVSYINIEHLSGNVYGIKTKYALLNGLILAAFICIAHSILKKGAYYVGAIFALLVGGANYYVTQFRGSELLLRDVGSFSTAMTVAGNYEFGFSFELFLGIASVTCLLLLKIFSDMKQKRLYKVSEPSKKSWGRSIAVRVAYAVTGMWILLFVNSYVNESSFNFYSFGSNFSKYGWCFANAVIMRYSKLAVPKDYTPSRIQTIIDSVETPRKEAVVPKNIIVIMNESFSDLEVLGELDVSEEVLPYYNGLSENTVKGNLHVSILGGNTCVSEWEFLTGNTEHFLPAGSIAYSSMKDEVEDSLCYTLSQQGYHTVAMHPYIKDNWNRDKAYDVLGFDEFLGIDDYENPGKIRNYVSDQADYDKIIEYYENYDKNDNLFIFNVTMQNHGGYGELNGSLEKTITIEGDEWDDMETYLSLVHESDKAFAELLDYFSHVDEPTLIMFFGDHQPNVPSSFLEEVSGKNPGERTVQEIDQQMITPYCIWTNYESDFQQYDDLSANYLSSYLLYCAGLDMTVYQQFLLQQMQKIPVVGRYGIIDDSGAFTQYELLDDEILLDYQILQYMRMKDKKSDSYYVFSQLAR